MPSTSELLFAVDTSGDASVRNSLLHAATSDVPASGRLRKGASFNKPLKSDLILAQRSKVPALTGRVVPSAGTVLRKDQEKMGRIDRATKERLNRIAGRDGKGQGLWSVKSGGAKEEALSEEVKNAGGYDAWEVKVRKVVPGEDLTLQAVVKASTTKGVPKVSSIPNLPPLPGLFTDGNNCTASIHIPRARSPSQRSRSSSCSPSPPRNVLQPPPVPPPSSARQGSHPLHRCAGA
jgi:hypothetical protein